MGGGGGRGAGEEGETTYVQIIVYDHHILFYTILQPPPTPKTTATWIQRTQRLMTRGCIQGNTGPQPGKQLQECLNPLYIPRCKHTITSTLCSAAHTVPLQQCRHGKPARKWIGTPHHFTAKTQSKIPVICSLLANTNRKVSNQCKPFSQHSITKEHQCRSKTAVDTTSSPDQSTTILQSQSFQVHPLG